MLFGVCALLVVGASWCLVGIVFGRAPKEGIDTGLIQFTSSIVSISASLIIATFFIPPAPCPKEVVIITCSIYFLQGFLNFWGLQCLGKAMKCGPNGVVWCIAQSALISPFTAGFLFFQQPLNTPRCAGLLLLLAALVLFAKGKKNNPDQAEEGNWRFFALLALAIFSVQQCFDTTPSYFESCRKVSPVLRAMSSASGVFTASLVPFIATAIRSFEKIKKMFSGAKNPRLYIYVFGMQFFSLIFAYTLAYPGKDAMAAAGAGSVIYPLQVGSCIVSFSLYSILALKEKTSPVQFLAIGLCLLGLAGLCFPPDFNVFAPNEAYRSFSFSFFGWERLLKFYP